MIKVMMLKKFIVEFLKLWTQSGFKNCCGRLTQIAPLNGSMAVGGEYKMKTSIALKIWS